MESNHGDGRPYMLYKNVKCIIMLPSILLELIRENSMLWPKLEWYQMIEAKELGKT